MASEGNVDVMVLGNPRPWMRGSPSPGLILPCSDKRVIFLGSMFLYCGERLGCTALASLEWKKVFLVANEIDLMIEKGLAEVEVF